jgi:putative nucleotidyltransferase with HDIG domain
VQYEEQRTAHDAIIRTLVQAVEIKDLYTRGHSERVARISEMIAGELRLQSERVEVLRYAATLHDVGKLGVPTRLLRKTGRLDEKEFEEIRLHPSRGVEVVRDIAFLDEAYSAILHHHERMDGLGYPSGLRGMRIPPFARIIAVADAFDSMTSTRSYRGARGSDEALAELRANSGTQFDPAIVDAIAAALARAELAGRPWRGDGTAGPGTGADPATARERLRDLPPGGVVAEFDHDDPAYQGPMPAVVGFLAEQPIDGGEFELEGSGEGQGEGRGDGDGDGEGGVESAGGVEESAGGVEPAGPPAPSPPSPSASPSRSPSALPSRSPSPSAVPAKSAPRDELRLGLFGTNEVNLPAQAGRGRDFVRGREAHDVPVDSGSGGCADPEGR